MRSRSLKKIHITGGVTTLTAILLLALPAEARQWAQPPPPRHVHVVPVLVPNPPPPPPRPVVVAHLRRDPYQTPGIVIAGAGLGGMLLRLGNGDQAVTPSYLLHLGLAVGDAEFALRANLVPEALSLPTGAAGSAGEQEVGIYATRASFNYRFLQSTPVHPVAGLGLEMIAASPGAGDDGYAFAATARLGLELAFPLSDGALALGLDTTGHLPFTRTKTFPIDLSFMLGFGAYVDYRF
jgi:hypothetical protein